MTNLLEALQCNPQPCWHGIRPGVTTMAEAEEIIRNDPSFCNIAKSPKENILVWDTVDDPLTGGSIHAMYKSRIIAGIYIRFSEKAIITLAELIDIYGQPLGLHFVDTTGPVADGIFILFEKNVTGHVYDIENPRNRALYPETPIRQIMYLVWRGELDELHSWTGFTEPEQPS
jgi:hypothetical protein